MSEKRRRADPDAKVEGDARFDRDAKVDRDVRIDGDTAIVRDATIVRDAAQVVTDSPRAFDALIERLGRARFALLGEATHGTHEFYLRRAELTKRLILEQGYRAVAVEADWPDAIRVNRYVRGESDDVDASAALAGFRRFPTWMWRNSVVRDFVEWLRDHNRGVDESRKVGFYGLDLYSLFTSIEEVLMFLETIDPEGARRARERYSCFDHYGEDSQVYGWAAAFDLSESCRSQAVAQLVELQRRVGDAARGRIARDDYFLAEQNARLIRNAEEYYRTMFRGRVSSWNLRDRHMTETLVALVDHLHARGIEAKIAVWEHNSHLGDARATSMGDAGEWNVGQLVRERHGAHAMLVGFTTYLGTVTAATEWNGPAERKRVRPALAVSYEALFHETGLSEFLLTLQDGGPAVELLKNSRLERAIGVIYLPATERMRHYFYARLARQFDAVIHIDRTQALRPLEAEASWETLEPPETFPSGL